MRIESILCHSSDNKSIVLVKGWIDDKIVGSALGEASTAEIAEDNAIIRLKKRINTNKLIINNEFRNETLNKGVNVWYNLPTHLTIEVGCAAPLLGLL